ncbi:MAG: hypothetical protein ACOZNI_08665 [Myxococcota bacterium]
MDSPPQTPNPSSSLREEHLDAFLIVKSLLRGTVDTQALSLVPDNGAAALVFTGDPLAPLARVEVTARGVALQLFGRREIELVLDGVNDLYRHGDLIRAMVGGTVRGAPSGARRRAG